MSLEKGGRADKLGNQYENRYLAKLFLYTLREHLRSVEVEPLGVDGVEFRAINSDGVPIYYQCKATNGAFDKWRMCDLKEHNVFLRAAQLLRQDERIEYHFISPLPYGELSELCDRARRSASAQDMIDFQLTNKELRDTFQDCAQQLSLDPKEPAEAEKIHFILSHCNFEQVPSNPDTVRDLEECISATLTGDANNVRILLEQLANDKAIYGIPITSHDILSYLEKNGIHFRQMASQESDLPRVRELNRQYRAGYLPIHGTLFHREESDTLFDLIQQGKNVLLCGKAGMGKSGCLQELLCQMEENGVLYLSLRLDKQIPKGSADAYGKELRLTHSPVHVLAGLSDKKPCVLIMDQLDSLRWTSFHSGTALDVCKEMIMQAAALNKWEGAHIVLVLVSRTIDYETDPGLHSLVEPASKELPTVQWERFTVGNLSDPTVVGVVGPAWEQYPARLQKMLRTPSSLYVWMKLDLANRSNSISSVYQLMAKWWEQIMSACRKTGLSDSDVIACRNKLVQGMERNGVLSLPAALFADEENVMDALASNGLVTRQVNVIAFSHQSFLDYFTVAEMINGLYGESKSLPDFLGELDDQLPVLRYRLLMVLQVLLDGDPERFLRESKTILDSEHIRYYFQCAVFEVAGQCDCPSNQLSCLTNSFLKLDKWHKNVFQMIYLGHPAFIRHLEDEEPYPWMSPEGLQLLSSIIDVEPEYVAAILRPLMFHSEEGDREIFLALRDPAEEAECLFELRLELLRKRPTLWKEFWGFSRLWEQRSPRAIPFLILMLQQKEVYTEENLHLLDINKWDTYVAQNKDCILSELYPALCHTTRDLALPEKPFGAFYKHWENSMYNEENARSIVQLLRCTFQHFAQTEPDQFLSLLNGKDHYTAVDQELMLCGILSLPESYADAALSWLNADFKTRVFDYTGNPYDYLSTIKEVLKKFSPVCSIGIFHMLETKICTWSDSPERMRDIFRYRLADRREGRFVTFGYWGHLQKALLPCLCQARLSTYAKELLAVLERNPGIDGPHYYCGFLPGEGGIVTSPVDRYRSKLSDKAWLKIICSPSEKMNERNWEFKNGQIIESSHRAFADAFYRQAQEEPERFAQLSLRFPKEVYHGYVYPVLSVLADTTEGRIDHNLTCDILRRFWDSPNIDVANDGARVLERRADEEWPEDILELLEKIATTHPIPEPGKQIFTSNADPEGRSPHSLHQKAINCPRGCGAKAIASLLWEHRDLGDRFRSVVLTLCKDPVDCVRFATVACAVAYYNIDPKFSFEVFDQLIERDLRVLAAPDAWKLIDRGYRERPDYYRGKLLDACREENPELAKEIVAVVVALATYYTDDVLMEFLLSEQFSADQISKLVRQAVFSFSDERAHDQSVKLLTYFIDASDGELVSLSNLFLMERIDIQRDADFLAHLMESRQAPNLMHAFLEYLKKRDGDLLPFAEPIAAAGRGIGASVGQRGFFDAGDLIQCVLRLFDQHSQDAYVRKLCLDTWDNLFQSEFLTAHQITALIEENGS